MPLPNLPPDVAVGIADWTRWPVERIMTTRVVTLTMDVPLDRAHELLTTHSLRHLPVVQGAQVVGMLSARDTAFASFLRIAADDCAAGGPASRPCTVREAMTKTPVTIQRHESIASAAQRMLEHRVAALPVIEPNGALSGIITRSDLLRKISG